jgi:hypothetical protein
MAKGKSHGGNGSIFDSPMTPAVPVQKYQRKFWKDYSDAELRGMGFGNRRAAPRNGWASTIIIATFILLFVGGCIWINVIGIP